MKDTEQQIDRRFFLKQSARYAVAVTVFQTLQACSNETNKNKILPQCKTTDDILGPFYKANAPFQENITPSESMGNALMIKGQVLSGCNTPVKDAIVEIWNANEKGEYDMSPEFKFRGKYQTSETGEYLFKTIIPGKYLNGNIYRPSHIHFRITAPDHNELISQLYFKDDPHIQTDPWASAPKASERILMIGKDENNVDTVNFVIYLNRV